jgi:hypothetical protein
MAKNQSFLIYLGFLIGLFSVLGAGAVTTSNLSKNEIRNKVKQTCESQIGVRELSGRNDGVQVETYLHSVNLTKGSPWCAAFISWTFQQVGVSNPKSGWSPDWFPKDKVVYSTTNPPINQVTPQPGDVFGIYFANKKRVAHVGFILEWHDTYAVTIEGNTNEAGSREGDGVYIKKRLKRQIYKVSNWI